jgi:hypothetical protein
MAIIAAATLSLQPNKIALNWSSLHKIKIKINIASERE